MRRGCGAPPKWMTVMVVVVSRRMGRRRMNETEVIKVKKVTEVSEGTKVTRSSQAKP